MLENLRNRALVCVTQNDNPRNIIIMSVRIRNSALHLQAECREHGEPLLQLVGTSGLFSPAGFTSHRIITLKTKNQLYYFSCRPRWGF